jgi:hypothetical protein
VHLLHNIENFQYKYKNHYLFESVIRHLDKSFRDVNQIAVEEIEKYFETKHPAEK